MRRPSWFVLGRAVRALESPLLYTAAQNSARMSSPGLRPQPRNIFGVGPPRLVANIFPCVLCRLTLLFIDVTVSYVASKGRM